MRSLTVICLIALAVYVAAHGHLTTPTARTGSQDAVHTTACGGVAKTTITATWSANSQQTIRWNIAANHMGNIYGYYVSLGIKSFVQPTQQISSDNNRFIKIDHG